MEGFVNVLTVILLIIYVIVAVCIISKRKSVKAILFNAAVFLGGCFLIFPFANAVAIMTGIGIVLGAVFLIWVFASGN